MMMEQRSLHQWNELKTLKRVKKIFERARYIYV